ncbi:MAG: hypothetical protein ABI672_22160 [Vicinamibacteria bacterium]
MPSIYRDNRKNRARRTAELHKDAISPDGKPIRRTTLSSPTEFMAKDEIAPPEPDVNGQIALPKGAVQRYLAEDSARTMKTKG